MKNLPYFSLNEYFKNKYNHRVQKITVSLPFTCPNIDGNKGIGGCIYCFDGSKPPGNLRDMPVSSQIIQGIKKGKKKYGNNTKFIVYFQTNTNTYEKIEKLKKYYDESIESSEDIIGIDIGTRPDCINENILTLIENYTEKLNEVWIEYGLQSANDETLKKINRGHNVDDFIKAVNLTKKTKIKIIAHIIIGFPWEKEEDFFKTAKLCAELKIDGIKIHPLYIMRQTKLGDEYLKNKFNLLTLEEYINVLTDIIELLPPNMVVMRFTAEGDEKYLLGPEYCKPAYKSLIKKMLISEFEKRGTKQGVYFKTKD